MSIQLIPWEAIVTLILATIGFIVWLTTISVTLNVVVKCVDSIEKTIHLIEAGYVKKDEFSKEIGRIEQTISAAHRRLDDLKK